MTTLELGRSTPPVHLVGWAASPGPLSYSNADLCEIFGFPREVAAAVEGKIGTRFRRSCVDLRTKQQLVAASTMAFAASAQALLVAELPPRAVQAVIGVGTIADYFCPPTSVRVAKLLGLDRALTFDLMGGCGAFAQGLFLAAQLLASGHVETALVVAAEPLTRHLWTVRRTWEAFAFGDGAAAMVLSTRHRGPFILRRCAVETVADLDGCRDEIMIIPVLGDVLPPLFTCADYVDPALPASEWPDRHRTLHRADLAARFGARHMAAATEAISAGIERAAIYLCPHQPSRVVLDAVRSQLGLSSAQVAMINRDFGNLSSASSPTAFCVRFAEGAAQYPWTVLAPVGTGLTCGAALFERVGVADDGRHGT